MSERQIYKRLTMENEARLAALVEHYSNLLSNEILKNAQLTVDLQATNIALAKAQAKLGDIADAPKSGES